MKKFVYVLIALVAVILIAYRARVVMERTRLEETKIEKTITPVEVQVVKKGSLTLSLNLIGDIKGKEEIDIFPKASGKLVQLKAREGDRVQKDQVVAVVDRDVDGLKYEQADVTSPISGIVTKRYLDEGAEVSPPSPGPGMGTALIRVINMDQVKVVVNVVEEDLGKISLGQKATMKVDAYPERTFLGRVSLISPVVNQLTRTADVEITLPNPEHLLKPGMFAQVEISLGKKDDLILIPAYSILQEGERKRVFVVMDGKAIPRDVETGISQKGWVEIKSGLSENDSLITSGQFLVKTDEPVKIIAGSESGSSGGGGER
jgi:multidrug efflux pump subunit AcrA (membrane-fusion protein)